MARTRKERDEDKSDKDEDKSGNKGGGLLKCSFCGKSRKQVMRLISGPGVNICDECIDLCNEIIEDELLELSDSLAGLGRNLTKAAREGELDPVIGREKEIERLMQVLSRHAFSIPVLIGSPGVGKTAVVNGLAHKIVGAEVPQTFADKQVYALDLVTLADMRAIEGDLNRRLEQIMLWSRNHEGVILFLDNLQVLTSIETLRPLLLRKELKIIGAMIPEEYDGVRDPALARVLVPIQVTEPTIPCTIEILKSLRNGYQDHHRITITDGALEAAAQLAAWQLPDRSLPGKAIDLLDEAASLGSMRARAEVDEALISETLVGMLGIPPEGLAEAPRFPPSTMTDDDREIWSMS